MRNLLRRNVNKYLLDSNNELIINVFVRNEGEDAFETNFYLVVPKGVDYSSAAAAESEVKISCTERTLAANKLVQCEIGNPLPGHKIVSVIF